jgi:predicted NBD/HSP70 family sugar kinase
MQLLGIHLADRSVTAVVVDDGGRVLRRAQRGGEDASAAAASVLAELGGDGPFDAAGMSSERSSGPAARIANTPSLRDGTLHHSLPGAAAVVAESWVGAARGASHVVCLSIGDQVLAGILLDGKPWFGAHGLAGSAAWLALNPVERQDYRKFGSLAAEVNNRGIARRLCWRIQAGDHSAVLDRAGSLESITASHVFEGARTGDGVSISVVRDTAKYIGMAIANLAAAVDPEVVVIAGDAATAGDLLLEPVRQECSRRLPPGMAEQFRLEVSTLGENGVAIGAARLAALARA